jgi:CBS domain-containing protein
LKAPILTWTAPAFDRCLLLSLVYPIEHALSMAVLDVMTRSAITVTPGDTLKRAMTLMTNHRVRHLIVIGNGQLVGI